MGTGEGLDGQIQLVVTELRGTDKDYPMITGSSTGQRRRHNYKRTAENLTYFLAPTILVLLCCLKGVGPGV